MTEAQKACLDKLKAQTAGKSGTVNMCGRQIWDILRTNAEFAEIVSADLDSKDMTVGMCERKIRAAADEKHKTAKGSSAGVSPAEAENIIRKFYGLPEIPERDPWDEGSEEPAPGPKPTCPAGIISLDDFF